MKKEDMTPANLMIEALGIVSSLIYIGLQIYYGISYGATAFTIVMNVLILLLVYALFTLLSIYPEKVNNLPREVCQGKIRRHTIRMVLLVKLVFVLSLLFTTICDILGHQMNGGYSLVVVVLILCIAAYYEIKIIKILKDSQKK